MSQSEVMGNVSRGQCGGVSDDGRCKLHAAIIFLKLCNLIRINGQFTHAGHVSAPPWNGRMWFKLRSNRATSQLIPLTQIAHVNNQLPESPTSHREVLSYRIRESEKGNCFDGFQNFKIIT